MKILKESDPFLKKVSEEVSASEIKKLDDTVEQMTHLMHDSNGIGLSAVQVGILKRFFIMHDPETHEEFLCINPTILETHGEKVKLQEGCLSYPLLFLKVPRYEKIVVEYQDIDGEKHVHILEGLMAQCYQHELDHLDGITFDTLVSRLHITLQQKKRDKMTK